jgi:adenylate cyclase
MAIEIERKFLVASDAWRGDVVSSERLRDGLLGESNGNKVRVRYGEKRSTLAVKGPRYGGARLEFEFEIPAADADAMLQSMCGGGRADKIRHKVAHGADLWRVDVYEGRLAGLVLAEIELARSDQAFARPIWLGVEVTHDPRFGKRALVRRGLNEPHSAWIEELLASVATAAS